MKEYLYIADPIKIDHLQPIFLHKSPTKGIEPPCRTTLVVVRNTKSSYLEQGCKDWQFVMVTLHKVVVISIGGIVTHVRCQIAVDVGVAEVCREAQTEDESSEDTQPASGWPGEIFGNQTLHFT